MKISHLTSIIILIAVSLWVLSGQFTEAKEKTEIDDIDNIIQTVRIERKKAIKKTKIISLYGVTQAFRRGDLKAETDGKVIKIPVNEGDLVKKGDVIVQIEMRARKADLIRTYALVRQRQIEFKSSQKLSIKGFQAENKLAESEALLEDAKAQRVRAEIELNNTYIQAPFDGLVEEINIELGDIIGPAFRVGQGSFNDGSTVATIIDNNPLLVVGYVSEKNVGDIKSGTIAVVKLVTGQVIEGKVRYISTVADQATRTFKVELEIANQSGEIVSGVTSSIEIPVKEQLAHHISLSSLALNKDGNLGVKAIEVSSEKGQEIRGKVKFYPIEIFESNSKGMWITSLPNEINLITLGHAFVSNGDEVIGKEQ